MEKDLGDKTINNEQQINEGFSGENVPSNYDPSGKPLRTEIEHDQFGNSNIVKRARNLNQDFPSDSDDHTDEAASTQTKKKNEDRNRDVADNRYPTSHPENKRDRGNIKTDDDAGQ